jgi:hypothetical protein
LVVYSVFLCSVSFPAAYTKTVKEIISGIITDKVERYSQVQSQNLYVENHSFKGTVLREIDFENVDEN